MNDALIDVWRRIIVGDDKSWVLFENGTCVILTQPTADLSAQAIQLIQEFGPVHVGTPAGDFNTLRLENGPGFVVTCHHPDILTYVAEDEVGDEPEDLVIGLTGRAKRAQDAESLVVIHVEDKGQENSQQRTNP